VAQAQHDVGINSSNPAPSAKLALNKMRIERGTA